MKITHDLHTHTVYSSDTGRSATFPLYIERAKKLGLTHLGFAEHFWDDSIEGAFPFYLPLTRRHMAEGRAEFEGYKDSDIKLYFGCEVEYDPVHHSPAITEATAETFDFILVPHSHSHETMPKEYYDDPKKHCDFLVEAYNDIINSSVSRYVTGMAHPFSLVRCPYPEKILIDLVSDDTFKRMFDKTAEKGIAVEIRQRSDRPRGNGYPQSPAPKCLRPPHTRLRGRSAQVRHRGSFRFPPPKHLPPEAPPEAEVCP